MWPKRPIDLLRLAGKVARDQGADTVAEAHVRAGNDDAEVTQLRDLIRGCPTQAKLAMAAIAAMTYRQGTHLELSVLDDPALILQSVGLDDQLGDLPFDEDTRQRIRQTLEH